MQSYTLKWAKVCDNVQGGNYFSRWNHWKTQESWKLFSRGKALKLAEILRQIFYFNPLSRKRQPPLKRWAAVALRVSFFGQNDRMNIRLTRWKTQDFLWIVFFTTSRLRRSYGEARNRVPASRHTLLAHSWALRGSPIHFVAGGELFILTLSILCGIVGVG